MSKDKLMPKLRFPEFEKLEEWQIKEVGEIFEVTRGDVLSMSLVVEEQSEINPYPVFSSQTKNNGLAGFYNDFLYEDAITWTTDGANAGDVNYRNGKFYCTNVCGVLLNKNGYANKCVAELINSVSKKYVSYVGNPKLMNGVMSQIEIPVPTILEQQKIASCLSSLDEAIAAHSQKLELLREHKKGLMQNLFPQEGEKVPKYRFKEFENDGEWEEITINKLVPQNEKYGIVDGPFGSNLKTIHYKTEGIPIITSGYVTNGVFNADKYLYVNEEKYNEEKRSSVKGGDIVMAKIGARCGASAIMPENHRIGILSGNALKITIDQTKHSTNFIWQQLWHLHSNDKFSGIKSIGAQPAISMESLKKFELSIPPKITEQQKIASCLSSLDELITAQAEKIEQLKLHKKGLMQGLFPKINE